MTTFSASLITHLNKMNKAAADVGLGTRFDVLVTASATQATAITNLSASATSFTGVVGASGSYAVAAADVTASRIVVVTGMAAVHGLIGQRIRSGSPLTSYTNFVAGSVAGTIAIRNATDVSGSPMEAGDILTWLAF